MTHIEVLESLAQWYGQPRYLEIGLGDAGCFQRVARHCSTATGVDVPSNPYGDIQARVERPGHAVYHGDGSNAFFDALNVHVEFDLIFIDGSHWYDQVKRDYANALERLAPLGTIALHDTWAATEEDTRNGSDDAYLVAQEIEADPTMQSFTIPIRPGLTLCRPNIPRFTSP